MKIAIAGAGIGGLAAAVLLSRAGHDITIFEQFASPGPVGSGLMIQSAGLKVLDRAGAGEAVRSMSAPIDRILGRSATSGRRVLDVHYGEETGLGIHRAALFQALYDRARALNLTWHTGHKVTGMEAGRLLFAEEAPSERFDLIVDASGASSALSPMRPRQLSFGAVWGTVDWVDGALPFNHLSQRYRRADRMIGILPVGTLPGGSSRKAALFWSLPQDGHAAWLARGLDAWKAEALSLWPEVEPFIAQVTDAGQMTMARYSHGSLSRPYGEGVVFIGDAARRASPQLGQGANMALLDAAALADALEILPLDKALADYARRRRWHIRIYQLVSAMFTPAYQSDSRVLPYVRDNFLFPLSQVPPVPYLLRQLVSGQLLLPQGR